MMFQLYLILIVAIILIIFGIYAGIQLKGIWDSLFGWIDNISEDIAKTLTEATVSIRPPYYTEEAYREELETVEEWRQKAYFEPDYQYIRGKWGEYEAPMQVGEPPKPLTLEEAIWLERQRYGGMYR